MEQAHEIVTVESIRVTTCSVSAGHYCELVCNGGQVVDPFVVARFPDTDQKERKIAEAMVGKDYQLTGTANINGCIVPTKIIEISQPDQGLLF